MYLVEFHIYVAYIYNNYKRTSIRKVYLKSCYVKLCKRLHLANYKYDYFTVTDSKYRVRCKFHFQFTAKKNIKLQHFSTLPVQRPPRSVL